MSNTDFDAFDIVESTFRNRDVGLTKEQAAEVLHDLWNDIRYHKTDYETLYSEEREEAFEMAMNALEDSEY